MIQGIGNDIVEIARIRRMLRKYGGRFYRRLFSEKECDYCLAHRDPSFFFAGRFSAKEAIAKACGTGFGKALSWLDIEILNEESGRPFAIFAPSFHRDFPGSTILVSISHCKMYAMATAVRFSSSC